jgi:hypothetical protein
MKKVSKKKEDVQPLDLQAPVDVAPESAMQVKVAGEPEQLSLFAYYQHRMEREASK